MKNKHNRFGGFGKTFPTLLVALLIVTSLFFTSGFASYASADETVVAPDAVVVTTDTQVSTEAPATPVVEEVTPAVEVIPAPEAVVEEVAPQEEGAPAPEDPAPLPQASVENVAAVAAAPAVLSTDKDDYHPG